MRKAQPGHKTGRPSWASAGKARLPEQIFNLAADRLELFIRHV